MISDPASKRFDKAIVNADATIIPPNTYRPFASPLNMDANTKYAVKMKGMMRKAIIMIFPVPTPAILKKK